MELPDYEAANIGEDNLLVKLWFNPTATLRYILTHLPDKNVRVLLALGGIARAVGRAEVQNSADKMPLAAVLLLAVLGGGAFGWLTYYVYAWAMSATGHWLNGRADTDTFKTVLAWALVPTIATLGLTAVEIGLVGDELFKSETAIEYPLSISLPMLVLGLLEIVLAVWAVVILVKGIMLIQGFRAGRAVANMLLPGAVLLLVIGAFVLLVKGLEAASA